MTKINFDNILKKLKELKRSYTYMFFLFGISSLFWYIYIPDLDIGSLIENAFLLAITFDNFIAIFIRLPYKNIPKNYPLWANILIRVILFLFVFFLLIHNLKKDSII